MTSQPNAGTIYLHLYIIITSYLWKLNLYFVTGDPYTPHECYILHKPTGGAVLLVTSFVEELVKMYELSGCHDTPVSAYKGGVVNIVSDYLALAVDTRLGLQRHRNNIKKTVRDDI